MNVVLAFITKNSASKLKQSPITLHDVLKSTLQVPWKSVIVVDASDDDTPSVFKDFCDKYGKELTLIRGGRTRGEARQIAIDTFLSNFNEEWMMFVDDDVILNKGWWDEARQYVSDPRTGIIWGINYDSGPDRYQYLRLLGVDYVQYLIREFFHRGGTHDTMIRRRAIEGIRIPPELHYYEDGFILKYVLEKGYEAKIVYAGCTHYNPWTGEHVDKDEIKRMAYLAKKYGFENGSIVRLLRSLASIVPHLIVFPKMWGFRRGLRRAFARWYTKVLFRWYLLTLDVKV